MESAQLRLARVDTGILSFLMKPQAGLTGAGLDSHDNETRGCFFFLVEKVVSVWQVDFFGVVLKTVGTLQSQKPCRRGRTAKEPRVALLIMGASTGRGRRRGLCKSNDGNCIL